MSDATVRPGGAAHPTRQQLDDLEALMQRMLALPVNQVESEPEAELPVLETEAVRSEEPAWQPVTPTVETVVSKPPSISPPAKPQAANPPAVLARVRSRWPRWIRWLSPFLWINRSFDAWTAQLGRPGRWLRSRQGRALLGALGLLFLAAAAGWMILGLVGWTW
jgi:hypothetical protein